MTITRRTERIIRLGLMVTFLQLTAAVAQDSNQKLETPYLGAVKSLPIKRPMEQVLKALELDAGDAPGHQETYLFSLGGKPDKQTVLGDTQKSLVTRSYKDIDIKCCGVMLKKITLHGYGNPALISEVSRLKRE